jgi:hypothetical protein
VSSRLASHLRVSLCHGAVIITQVATHGAGDDVASVAVSPVRRYAFADETWRSTVMAVGAARDSRGLRQ